MLKKYFFHFFVSSFFWWKKKLRKKLKYSFSLKLFQESISDVFRTFWPLRKSMERLLKNLPLFLWRFRITLVLTTIYNHMSWFARWRSQIPRGAWTIFFPGFLPFCGPLWKDRSRSLEGRWSCASNMFWGSSGEIGFLKKLLNATSVSTILINATDSIRSKIMDCFVDGSGSFAICFPIGIRFLIVIFILYFGVLLYDIKKKSKYLQYYQYSRIYYQIGKWYDVTLFTSTTTGRLP